MTKNTEKRPDETGVIAEFTSRRKKITRLAILLGIITGAVAIVSYQDGISKTSTAILLAVSFTWAIIVNVKIWRCPSCNGHLGRLYLGLKEPKYCPKCGIKLVKE